MKILNLDFKIKMSSFTTSSSSADEFSPLQPIFPNLSTSEKMSVLIARIAELNRAKTMEPSVASSEVFGQDGYGMNDDEFSLDDEEEEDEQQEDRKTPTKDVSEDHLKAILERIGELEKQQQQQSIATAGQLSKILEKIGELEKQNENTDKAFLQSQNDQKKILEKISEMEKQRKKKVFLKFQENFWDGFACNKDIEIIGNKSLIVHHKGNPSGYWHSVFAKYPIVLNKHLSDFFYYEISVQKKEKNWPIIFGFAVNQQTKLDGPILCEKGTYVFISYGYIWINGKGKGRNDQYSYGVGDTVGIGVNSATRKMIFTKNGLRLDTSDFLIDPSFADGSLNPFVTLLGFGEKIEANFGPNFKFDLATL